MEGRRRDGSIAVRAGLYTVNVGSISGCVGLDPVSVGSIPWCAKQTKEPCGFM